MKMKLIFSKMQENRPSAIRCLMLFPLNALVEDQKKDYVNYLQAQLMKN